MGNSERKNTKKLAVIITYAIAVVCLLLGLLLPVFFDKGVQGMLIMQLPDALDIVCGGKGVIKLGNEFASPYPINLFGLAKASVDITAWAIVLYAVITFFALLAFIPMGVTFKKSGKVTRIFAYVIEIAAVLALSIYVLVALEAAQEGFKLTSIINIWVAFGGTLLMLIIQCFVNKSGKSAAVKFILFILSTVAVCSLFEFYLVSPKFSEIWIKLEDSLKCAPNLYGFSSGINYYGYSTGIDLVNVVFADSFIEAFKVTGTAIDKTVLILGAIISVFTALNFFIDVIALSTNAKRKGLIFNCVRYGIPFLAAICLFITVAVAKELQGLSLALLFVIIAIELAINLGILLRAVVREKKHAKNENAYASGQELEYGVNDYANFERKPKRAKKAKSEPAAQPIPDYSDNTNPNPYAYPYSRPFGSEQSFLNPFGNSGLQSAPEAQPEPEQPAVQESPSPAYDPTLGYPAEYLNPSQEYKPPVQEYNPVQDYRNYQPVQDYQPAKQPLLNEEPKPAEPTVHNVYSTYPPTPQQDAPAEHVYRVNTVYQGPTDEFLRKLTNEEKIEFAMIFIERSKGEIGKVPEYAIGGDNKKFFSSVFIYLGRIRGIISDGLLNKMYKEINMFR